MKAREELVERCALRRREKIGTLSDQGYAELLLAVRQSPESFVDNPEEEAFLEVTYALEAYERSQANDEFLDDEQFLAERTRRLSALSAACNHAASIDENCLDARLIEVLAQDFEPHRLLEELMGLEREASVPKDLMTPEGDAWPNVLLRPNLRLRAAVARTCLDGARYRMAERACRSVMDAAPNDELGCRCTCAIALARLEDEDGFDLLDARFSRHGNPWSHLARVLLLYKLNRMPAARRALRGYDELCEGGAYALLHPTYVEIYLPDRPDARPGSFEESNFAVHEAEPIIADVPDFIGWCQGQDWLYKSAERFAENNDYDW